MKDLFSTERTLAREIVPEVERTLPGVEVLAVEVLSPSRFCVYVDHPEGVDHALCARVTRLLDRYRESYTIDVSSPGPHPPLRKATHFERAVGRRVQLRTREELAGKTKFKAEVVAAGPSAVTVTTGDDTTLEIPYESIVRGNLIDEG